MFDTKVVVVKITGSNNEIKVMSAKLRQDGVLVKGPNFPLFVSDDFVEAGLPIPKVNQKWEAYSPVEQALALTIDHPRVEWKEKPEIRAWLNGEVVEEDTRERQNEFLRSKRYKWQKRSIYHSGDGEMVDRWLLLDPDGKIVVGVKDGGFDLIPFGNVKSILTELGYYGQEAIDKEAAEKKASTERREMRDEVFNHFAQYPIETPDQVSFETQPIYLESHMPRRRFRIEGDALWIERHNTSDGDDWSLNNCDYGIASRYPFDAKIADYLRTLSQ